MSPIGSLADVLSSYSILSVGVGLLIATGVSALMVAFFLPRTQSASLPVIDQYPDGKRLDEKELQHEFMASASRLIEAGISKVR